MSPHTVEEAIHCSARESSTVRRASHPLLGARVIHCSARESSTARRASHQLKIMGQVLLQDNSQWSNLTAWHCPMHWPWWKWLHEVCRMATSSWNRSCLLTVRNIPSLGVILSSLSTYSWRFPPLTKRYMIPKCHILRAAPSPLQLRWSGSILTLEVAIDTLINIKERQLVVYCRVAYSYLVTS